MHFRRSLVFLVTINTSLALTSSGAGNESIAPAFVFRGDNYFHRWSKDDQHEFTPAKQEDLDHWSDMITINVYPGVDEGEKMAGTANAVLGNYKSHQGTILKTRSVPMTKESPAEHFISVMFVRPQFVEVAFARFKIVDQKGYSFVYSHRIYGDRVKEKMDAWVATTAAEVEKALMEWSFSPASLHKS